MAKKNVLFKSKQKKRKTATKKSTKSAKSTKSTKSKQQKELIPRKATSVKEILEKTKIRGIKNPEKKMKALKARLRALKVEANARMRDLEKYSKRSGLQSPALQDLKLTGGSIKYTANMNEFELRSEIMRAITFLRDETSETEKAIHISNEIANEDDKWYIFKQIRKFDPSVQVISGKYSDLISIIDDYILEQNYSASEIINMAYDDYQASSAYGYEIDDSIQPFRLDLD